MCDFRHKCAVIVELQRHLMAASAAAFILIMLCVCKDGHYPACYTVTSHNICSPYETVISECSQHPFFKCLMF